MFNSSLRRVARTCPNAALSRPSSTASHGPIAATFATHSHQRRNSSSKPPIPPNNGSPPIPAASVKQVGAPRSTDKRPTESRLSKRKVAKAEKTETGKQKEEISSEWARSLPSVPSTQHLNPKDVYVASFFSTHRPISITGPLPPETSVEDIDKIFKVRPRSRNTQDVIYTIASAVQNLEEGASQQVTQHEEGVTQRVDIIKALTQHNTATQDSNTVHLDGQPQQMRVPGNVKLVIQALARQFRPFNPPPVPVAAPDVEFFAPEAEASAEASESMGEVTMISITPSAVKVSETQSAVLQAIAEKSGNTFFTPSYQKRRRSYRATLAPRHLKQLARLSIRDVRKIGGIKRMVLISVRRQRKLKMKKHKYKKLMRKTRNLRRRQGKI